MGCDIHFYVEKRDDTGKWVSLDQWYDDPDQPGRKTVYNWGPGMKILAGPIYRDRNYALFSILADVRNGRGFGGCDRGDGFAPISEPKGVPEDASPEYKAEVESWDGDGHSHSWLTLTELLCYDWTQTTTFRGFVSPVEWARWRDYGAPDSWAGGVGGWQVTCHTVEQFEAAWQKVRTTQGYPEQRYAFAHLEDRRSEDYAMFVQVLGGGSPYTQVSWQVAYADTCRGFWADCIPKLLARSAGRFDDLRIVFFFDN